MDARPKVQKGLRTISDSVRGTFQYRSPQARSCGELPARPELARTSLARHELPYPIYLSSAPLVQNTSAMSEPTPTLIG